jgi:hypothetical protein
VNAVGRRWQQTDHFDWLSLYLNNPGYPADLAGDGRRCYRLDCHGSGCGVGQGDRAALPSRGRRGTDCQRLRRYRGACPPTSLVARFGGEGFVVADTYRNDDLLDIAEQLRMAIAAIDFPVTASIGIATAPLAASSAHLPHADLKGSRA